MASLTIRFPDRRKEQLEKLVEEEHYPSKSEAVRDAVRELLDEYPDLEQ